MNNNYNSNTVVDGRAAHMTDTTRQSAPEHPPPPPYQIMLDPSLVLTLMKRSKCCGYLRLHSHTKLYINFQCSFISKILLLGHHKINQIWMMMVLEMEQFIFTMAGKMGNSIHINRFVYFIQFT